MHVLLSAIKEFVSVLNSVVLMLFDIRFVMLCNLAYDKIFHMLLRFDILIGLNC